ncbi:MAG TPA: sugar ABC transporter ATP-binding protein [Thermotogaceae bacterium]|nr:sugar ABC transporter ATP-binding protein [Thermotogaceae bacterium]
MVLEPILKAKKIVKNFGGVKALREVDFDLFAGEVHALVGENGAGKSTLIKILTGVLEPDSGEIEYFGKKLVLKSPREAHEAGIVAVYQEPLVYKHLSVVENIFLGNEIKKKNGNVDWQRERSITRELLKSLDIDPYFIDEPMGSLSTGLQQLTLIAKALNYNAKVIIFDEPTAILTEHEAQRLFSIIERLKEKGVGIIYISHRLEELPQIADRITIMRDGQVMGNFDMNQVTREKIIELMAGHTLIEELKRTPPEYTDVVLEVRNLSKKGMYQDIDFKLYRGEILGFSGLVGAGRSEVMQTIFGLIKPDSGEIIINGKKVNVKDPSIAMKLGIAYIPEDRGSQGLFKALTINFNVTIPIIEQLTKFLGIVDNSREKEIATRYLKWLQIKAPSIYTLVNNLSGGNQQKVLIAKWLATSPKILILDEPTRGVDVAVKSQIHNEILRLADSGISIIVVSSELPEIIKLSDRVIVMHEGRITGRFDKKESITPTNLLNAATGARMVYSRD